MEVGHASGLKLPAQNSHQGNRERRESSRRHRKSIGFPALRDNLRAGGLELFPLKCLFQASEEIGHNRFGGGLGGKKTGDDAFAFGDLDFFAVAKGVFDDGEVVAEVADGGFAHVIHFSITNSEEKRKNLHKECREHREERTGPSAAWLKAPQLHKAGAPTSA